MKYFILFSLIILGCSSQDLEAEKESLQSEITILEEQFPLLITNHCYFEDLGDSLIAKCPNNSDDGALTETISYKDDKIITISYGSKYGASYKNWSNPESLIKPIKKSPNLKIYTSNYYRTFHECGDTFLHAGKTTVVTDSEYKSIFTYDLKNCENNAVCVSCVAKKTDNIELCKNISNRDVCLRIAAPLVGDLDDCKMIRDNSSRAWCILELAKEQKDEIACSELPKNSEGWDVHYGAYKELCIEMVNIN